MYIEIVARTARVVPWLEALEAELERPLRILNGRGRTYRHRPWDEDQAFACGNRTVEDCEATGITLVEFATLGATDYLPNGILVPEALAGHAAYIDNTVWDTFAVPDLLPNGEALKVGDQTIGAVFGRTVVYAGTMLQLAGVGAQDRQTFNIDPLVRLGIEACLVEGLDERIAEAAETINRELFLNYVAETGETGVTQIRVEVEKWAAQLTTFTQGIAKAKLKLREQQAILDAVLETTDAENIRETRLAQWDMLAADERLERVDFDADSQLVIIETGPTNLTHPVDGRTVYLGKFRWQINVRDGSIFVENLDNQLGGFDHPHIWTGRPCFGDMGETISTLIMQGRLHPAVDMIFVFLGSVQLRDDYGRRAALWFEQPTVDELATA